MSHSPTRRFDGTTVIDNPVGYKVPISGVRVSFEADEKGVARIHVPFRGRVTRIRSIVTKALAAGEAGTLTFTSPKGELVVLSHTASAPLDQSRSSAAGIDSDAAILESGHDIHITPAKVTSGGRVQVDIDILRIEGP